MMFLMCSLTVVVAFPSAQAISLLVQQGFLGLEGAGPIVQIGPALFYV